MPTLLSEPRLEVAAFHVVVTERDVEQGYGGLPTRCPIALAVRRALLEQPDIDIASRAESLVAVASNVWVGRKGYRIIFEFSEPSEAWRFQSDVDSGESVKTPFAFDLVNPRLADR